MHFKKEIHYYDRGEQIVAQSTSNCVTGDFSFMGKCFWG